MTSTAAAAPPRPSTTAPRLQPLPPPTAAACDRRWSSRAASPFSPVSLPRWPEKRGTLRSRVNLRRVSPAKCHPGLLRRRPRRPPTGQPSPDRRRLRRSGRRRTPSCMNWLGGSSSSSNRLNSNSPARSTTTTRVHRTWPVPSRSTSRIPVLNNSNSSSTITSNNSNSDRSPVRAAVAGRRLQDRTVPDQRSRPIITTNSSNNTYNSSNSCNSSSCSNNSCNNSSSSNNCNNSSSNSSESNRTLASSDLEPSVPLLSLETTPLAAEGEEVAVGRERQTSWRSPGRP